MNFDAKIRIKSSGKTPVEMCLTFDGIPPFVAPMPPGKYTIKAESVVDLYYKTDRWLRRNGYIFYIENKGMSLKHTPHTGRKKVPSENHTH